MVSAFLFILPTLVWSGLILIALLFGFLIGMVITFLIYQKRMSLLEKKYRTETERIKEHYNKLLRRAGEKGKAKGRQGSTPTSNEQTSVSKKVLDTLPEKEDNASEGKNNVQNVRNDVLIENDTKKAAEKEEVDKKKDAPYTTSNPDATPQSPTAKSYQTVLFEPPLPSPMQQPAPTPEPIPAPPPEDEISNLGSSVVPSNKKEREDILRKEKTTAVIEAAEVKKTEAVMDDKKRICELCKIEFSTPEPDVLCQCGTGYHKGCAARCNFTCLICLMPLEFIPRIQPAAEREKEKEKTTLPSSPATGEIKQHEDPSVKTMKMMSECRDAIKVAKRLGIDIAGYASEIENAQKAYSAGDYELAHYIVKTTKKQVDNAIAAALISKPVPQPEDIASEPAAVRVGKPYPEKLPVPQPSGPPANQNLQQDLQKEEERAGSESSSQSKSRPVPVCLICTQKIGVEEPRKVCKCSRVYHLACAMAAKECPVCFRPIA
ncbi:MAG: hypothetical protein QW728_08175 [Thermoplasmata archaeon]